MNETSPLTALAGDELPLEEEYRPLSMLCVFALLAGLASPLALAHPILAVMPLIAAVLAVVALRSVSSAPRPMTGRSLAVAGLCLAMLFLGWGVARRFHHKAVVRSSAREFADDWLRLLASGDRHRAHQLHVAHEFRVDPHARTQQVYLTDEQATSSLTEFFQNPALEKFMAAGPSVRYRFVEVTRQYQDQLADLVVLKYVVDGKERFPMWITVRRTFPTALHATDWELYIVDHEARAIE
jgi:hypothetical protein